MNCLVCSSPASGFHYKITTCRACASFFRRTFLLKMKYKCQHNDRCEILEGNRLFCKQCRLKKCLEVGMIPPEETDPDFLHGLNVVSKSPLAMDENTFFTIDNAFSNSEKFFKQLKHKVFSALRKNEIADSCDIFVVKQADLAYKYHENQWPCTKDTIIEERALNMRGMQLSFYREFLILAEACSKIKPFARLPFRDKVPIYKEFIGKFVQLERTFVGLRLLGDDRDDLRVLSLDGKIWNKREMDLNLEGVLVATINEADIKKLMNCAKESFESNFTKPFKTTKPDRFEFLYLAMSTLFDTRVIGGISPEAEKVCQAVLGQLGEELQYYYKYERKLENPAPRIWKLHTLLTLLDRVAELKKQDCLLTHLFSLFKIDCKFFDLDVV